MAMKMPPAMMLQMLRSMAGQAVVEFTKDKRMMLVLATAFGGLAAVLPAQRRLAKGRPSRDATRLAAGGKAGSKKKGKKKNKKSRAKINAKSLSRLKRILAICVPRVFCYETALLVTQATVLISRSLLSLRIARQAGEGLKAVLQQDVFGYGRCLVDFWICGVAASVVNSALKYLTNCITVAFRTRLTKHVHDKYLANRNFYKAAVLRVGALDNADQRIVDDLQQFCKTAADLVSRTFKPAFDVVMATRRMAEGMGYQGLFILYSYFIFSGGIVRIFSPPFSKLIAQQQVHEGNFRRLHTRLIANAEEIAFLDGADREKELLNTQLGSVASYNAWYFWKQMKQGVLDQYFLKYFASIIGWPVLALPFLFRKAGGDIAEVAARYRESDTLIQTASSSLGDLLMLYKKVQRLLGFTDRVMELLDAVEVQPGRSGAGAGPGQAKTLTVTSDPNADIQFDNVTIHTPEAKPRLLLKDLNLRIKAGCNVLITGANGAGKTSLFRVLAGLWEATDGTVQRPTSQLDAQGNVSMFYVPQRPYLVTGSLRDQITYPLRFAPGERDADVEACLRHVNLAGRFAPDGWQSVPRGGLNRIEHDWADVFSGGEQQRMGLARLYFHKPKFAVLDEATSAINTDEEGEFYKIFSQLGITVFSIAHRLELQRFHQQRLHFKADGTGRYVLLDCPAKPNTTAASAWWATKQAEL